MKSTREAIPPFIPCLCLFLSGVASLAYELIWIRQLTLVFGGTLYAISSVLCAFMAGLALGAWGVSRILTSWASRGRAIDLILLYGVLEGLIGLYALLFPLGLGGLERIYPWAMGMSLDSGFFLHGLEFLLSALLILPPTVLMGATLPVIGSWLIGGKAHRVFKDIALLYSLNTFGAVAGCLYAQLFAIKVFGVRGATWSAVGLNFLILLICLLIRSPKNAAGSESANDFARPLEMNQIQGDEETPSKTLGVLLLAIFIYSGMAALSSEILWTRALVFPIGSTLYSFALILATFLFSIALGSLIAERLLGNSKWIQKFLLIELAIGIACIAILPLFDYLPEWTTKADALFYGLENTPARTLLIRSLFAFGLMFLPTLGFGLIFPLANRIHLNLFRTVSGTLGNCYALNTLGAVLGTVLTPFLLIPLWGIRLSLFLIYSLLIVLVFIAFAVRLKLSPLKFGAWVSASLVLLAGGFAYSDPVIETDRAGNHNFARTEVNVESGRNRLLDYKEGDFTTLSVVEDVKTGARTLYVNGFSTATVSDSVGGSAYMQAMGFVPMALHPNPKRALALCFGTGATLGTVSLFPGVQVDGVEIDRNVLSFAHWFSKWNHSVLDRPNVKIAVQDGRTFVRWTEETYDVITLEPMSPVQAGVVNLYSEEFYRSAAERLNPGGLMMQWMPLHLVGREDAKSIIKTFQRIFPHTSVWNSFLTRIALLVGSRQPIPLDRSRFEEVMRRPELGNLARKIGINSFLDFTDFFITDGKRLEPYIGNAPIITDDRPILEFSPVTLLPPMKWETDESFLNLLRYRIDQFPPVKNVSGLEESRWRRDFMMRTAQRLAVFSRRYHGPGEEAFSMKNPLAGLEAVRIALQGKGAIQLSQAQWKH